VEKRFTFPAPGVSVTPMSLDDTTIRDLIDFHDAHGVLSFYVGHTPERAADPQPAAPIEIRNQVKALRADLLSRDGDTTKAVDKRLDEIQPEIDRLVDPRQHGRGRALFVGVDSGRTERVALQIPFRERVVHHDSAFVRPLVAAHDEGRAAGVLVVSRQGCRLLRWSVGEVQELETWTFETGDLSRQKSGPTPAMPQHPGHGTDHKERHEERVDENRHRFLRQVAEEAEQAAKEHTWDRLVLSAPPKMRDEVSGLLHQDGYRLLVAEQAWEEAAPHEIAEHAFPLLRSVHLDREKELVDTALERALGGNAGAVGLRNVCAALNEGRVSRLLFREDLQLEGYVSEEGTLHPRVEGVTAASDLELTRQPLFVERMIEKAVSTSADVTPVNVDVAAALDDHEGVAALLRW
jgi:peptide subunit release factor 1 (eRF1)